MGLKDTQEIDIDFDIEDVEVKKVTWFKKICDYIYDDIYWHYIGWRINDFKASVKKLIRWFPIIWKDRDWDDHYIWELLKNKLRWQAKYIGDRDFHTRAALDAKRMRLCANLIDKVQEEFYHMEYMDYEETKWRFTDVPEKSGYSQMHIDTISERLDDYIKKYPLVAKRILNDKKLQVFSLDDLNEYELKKRLSMNIGRYNHLRAKKLLFKIMEENIECWWD